MSQMITNGQRLSHFRCHKFFWIKSQGGEVMKKVFVALGSVALVLLITTGAFAAKGMLTGADITDGSITGRDIKNGSLTAADLSASARASLHGRNGVDG